MKHSGICSPPVILIHGGVNLNGTSTEDKLRYQVEIGRIISTVWADFEKGQSAVDAVCAAVELLEAAPCFNAGRGSSLQVDGLARLTASLMDGNKQRFTAVNQVTHMIHPSKLARVLQERDDRVLGPLGAQLLARELSIDPADPTTNERMEELIRKRNGEVQPKFGTVGAVALDGNYCFAAATSTGGRSNEYPDRMSDAGTAAGNYASKFAAISCTGIGEQITDDGVAVRLETRVRDGKTIIEASDMAYQEAVNRHHRYGWIGLDKAGSWGAYFTTEIMTVAQMSSTQDKPWVAENLPAN